MIEPEPIVQYQAPLPAAEPEPAPAVAAPIPQPEPEPQAAVAPMPEPERVTPEAAKPGEYGPVAPGQTLSEIASALRPAPVSLNQMMVALLHANPDAFGNDNINVLKRGAVLRVPGQDEVDRLSEVEAAALVSQQITPGAPR